MMLVLCVVVAVGLLSLGEAAPLTNTCQDMLTPLQMTGPDLLLGKWMFVGESTEVPGVRWVTQAVVDGGWVEVTRGASDTTQDVLHVQKMLGECFGLNYNVSFDKNTFTMVDPYHSTYNLLQTSCPDCLLIKESTKILGKTFVSLQFLSKRRELSADELDTFKQQAKCLNLYPPSFLDPKMDLENCRNETLRYDLNEDFSELFYEDEEGRQFREFFTNLQKMEAVEFIRYVWNSIAEQFDDFDMEMIGLVWETIFE